MQGGFIETYGDPHLHSGFYPIPENEKEMHRCDEGMYCDNFPADFHSGPVAAPHEGPVIMRHSSDPRVRYGKPEDASFRGEVGVGCMNLNCMAPNCHGVCKRPYCNTNVGKEGFGIGCGCSINNGTMMYLGLAAVLFAVWYFYLRKK